MTWIFKCIVVYSYLGYISVLTLMIESVSLLETSYQTIKKIDLIIL